MGGGALGFQSAGAPPDPCSKDDRTFQLGPGALTYTTAPVKSDTVLAGPIDATIYAASNRPETQLVATVEDIAPDGTSLPLTQGALLGSFRALDKDTSWWALSVAAVDAPRRETETCAFFSAIESLIPSPTKQTDRPSC